MNAEPTGGYLKDQGAALDTGQILNRIRKEAAGASIKKLARKVAEIAFLSGANSLMKRKE